MNRGAWAGASDPLMLRYHDEEWGMPSHDERHLFEMLTLEGAQAGLSWTTILRRREGYRRAFAEWDVDAIARFGADDVARLLADTAIIRNRAKIDATIANARAVVGLHDAGSSLDALLWSFVGGTPIEHRFAGLGQIPAETGESRTMSRELKGRAFTFVGPTICYALMQACGLVNDHTRDCFRWTEVQPGSSRA